MTRWTLFLLWLALSACSRTPQPTPPAPDSGDGGPANCATDCANLRALGCPEGNIVSVGDASVLCETICQHAVDFNITPIDHQCISTAPSKAVVRGCAGMQSDCQ